MQCLLVYIRTYNAIFLSHVVTCARFNCAESNVLTSVVSLLSSRDDVLGHDKHFHYKPQFLLLHIIDILSEHYSFVFRPESSVQNTHVRPRKY